MDEHGSRGLYDQHRETCGVVAASASASISVDPTGLNLNDPAPLPNPTHPLPVAGEDDLPPPPPMADPGDGPSVEVPNYLLGFTQLLSSSPSPFSCPHANPNPLDLGIWPGIVGGGSSSTPTERNPNPPPSSSSGPNLSLSSSLLGLSEEEKRLQKKKNKCVIENPILPPPPPPLSSSSSFPFADYGLMNSIQGPSLSHSPTLFGSKLLPFSAPNLSLHTNWSLDPTAAAIGPQNSPAAQTPPPPPPPPPPTSSSSFFPELWSSFRSLEETAMTTTTMPPPPTTATTMPTMGFGGFRPWLRPPLMSAPDALSFGCASGSSNYVGLTMNTDHPLTGGGQSVTETQCEAPPPDVEVYRPTMVDATATPSETQGGMASGGGGPSLRQGGDGERPGEREIDGFTELMLSSFNGEGAFGSDFW